VVYLCSQCNKVLDNVAVDKAFAVAYNECKGKKCPDCGKIRKLGVIKMTLFNAGASDACPRCGKDEITAEFSSSPAQGTCNECFWERESSKGCICIHSRCKWGRYYCLLCEDIHMLNFKCKECAARQEETKGIKIPVNRQLISPWKVVVPSVLGGTIIGVIIGFITTKIILKKKNQKTLCSRKKP